MIADLKSPTRPRRWKPSAREQAIYRAVIVEGRTQRQAGEEFGRSQSAVSRLLKRFERWRGGANPVESGDLDPVRQAHFDRWLARQRHDEIYTRSMRLAQRMETLPATIQRTRTDPQGQAVWSEETKRDQLAAAGQMLKTALRANTALENFAEKEPLPPIPGTETEVDYEELLDLLTKLRQEAEQTGRAPQSRTRTTADIWLRALVGQRQEWYLAHHDSDLQAIVELIQSVLESRIGLKAAVVKTRAGEGESGRGGDRGQETEDRGQETEDRGRETAPSNPQATPAANPQSEIRDPQAADNAPPTDSPPTAPTHQTHTRIFVGGHPPEAADLAASSWPERFYGDGQLSPAEREEATSAREKSADFSAAVDPDCLGGTGGRLDVCPTSGSAGAVGTYPADDAPAPRAETPPAVGSPEWQIARAKWLAERDQRRIEAAAQKIRDEAEKREALRQRRALLAERNRRLEAGRVEG